MPNTLVLGRPSKTQLKNRKMIIISHFILYDNPQTGSCCAACVVLSLDFVVICVIIV